MNFVYFYNSYVRLNIIDLENIMGQVGATVVWVGDFQTHNPLWGRKMRDSDGNIMEELIDIWISVSDQQKVDKV